MSTVVHSELPKRLTVGFSVDGSCATPGKTVSSVRGQCAAEIIGGIIDDDAPAGAAAAITVACSTIGGNDARPGQRACNQHHSSPSSTAAALAVTSEAIGGNLSLYDQRAQHTQTNDATTRTS